MLVAAAFLLFAADLPFDVGDHSFGLLFSINFQEKLLQSPLDSVRDDILNNLFTRQRQAVLLMLHKFVLVARCPG